MGTQYKKNVREAVIAFLIGGFLALALAVPFLTGLEILAGIFFVTFFVAVLSALGVLAGVGARRLLFVAPVIFALPFLSVLQPDPSSFASAPPSLDTPPPRLQLLA